MAAVEDTRRKTRQHSCLPKVPTNKSTFFGFQVTGRRRPDLHTSAPRSRASRARGSHRLPACAAPPAARPPARQPTGRASARSAAAAMPAATTCVDHSSSASQVGVGASTATSRTEQGYLATLRCICSSETFAICFPKEARVPAGPLHPVGLQLRSPLAVSIAACSSHLVTVVAAYLGPEWGQRDAAPS